MKLIDCDLEKQMILIESKRDNIKSARHILERALCQQFQLLTLAIYSSEILKGNKLKKGLKQHRKRLKKPSIKPTRK